MSSRPQPHPSVLGIAPYVPGASSGAAGQGRVHKLSSNEAPHGPGRLAQDAYRDAAANLALYPDGGATALREAIGAAECIDPALVVCGNGSDELLGLLARLYLAPGDEAVMSEHAFLMYRIHTLACGGVPVLARDRALNTDVDALLAAVTDRTRIVFLANPNNPTGTCLPRAEVERLAKALPPSVLLVIDAAYAEYVKQDDYEAGKALVAMAENVVMTRTFSKIHGLAALRIGWLYAPAAVVDALHRIRGPFNMSGPAIAAGVAAINDHAHVAAEKAFNTHWRARLTRGITELGLEVTPSEANFLLFHVPMHGSGRSAREVHAGLSRAGFILRPVVPYGLPDALRVSVGTDEANLGFLAALAEVMTVRPQPGTEG